MIDGVGRGPLPRMVAMGGEVTARGPAAFDPATGPKGVAGGPKFGGIVREMAASPPVDSAKVETLKQAIASGSYKVDAEAIAARMMAFGRK